MNYQWTGHRHECRGMHWPAVLPSDVTLAGCILVKHIEEQNPDGDDFTFRVILDLCQNYGRLSAETKLEFHVYSVILLHCLQKCYASKLSSESDITSEIVLLLEMHATSSVEQDLCQNYGRLSAETKLEFHVYSVILLHCLQKCYASKLSSESAITSELLSCFLKCSDGKQPLAYDATSSAEQANVIFFQFLMITGSVQVLQLFYYLLFK
ncbi:hypothetical protein OROHE_001228 [Orobanche hederae]